MRDSDFYEWLSGQHTVCAVEAAKKAALVSGKSVSPAAVGEILATCGYVKLDNGRTDTTYALQGLTHTVDGRVCLLRQQPLTAASLAAYVADMGTRSPPDAEGLWLWLHVPVDGNHCDKVIARWAFYPTDADGVPSRHLFFFWPDSRKGMHRAASVRGTGAFMTQTGAWLCAPAPHVAAVSDEEVEGFRAEGWGDAIRLCERLCGEWPGANGRSALRTLLRELRTMAGIDAA